MEYSKGRERMDIRNLEQADLKQAMDLVWQVFCVFEAPEYTEEGVGTFSDFIELDAMRQRLADKDMLLYGCYEKQTLLGVLAAKPTGHISLFFVRQECQGRGVGRALFEKHLQYARQTRVSSITVNSSPYAVPIYGKLGFRKTGEEQTINGIRFTPMAYRI